MDGGDLNVVTADLFPENPNKYYHYVGSLTTPPCSENVKWYILKEIMSLDAQQLEAFRANHKNNFRPIQEMNGRYLEAR